MKKLLLADGAGLIRLFMVLVVLGGWCFLVPSSFAQTPHYDIDFIGFPSGSVPLSRYVGLDRKLKPDVPGHILRITVTPALTTPQRVQLTIRVSATGSSVSECNRLIAWATTAVFEITGVGRDLGASAFTGSSAIGVQNSDQDQGCIDALADKIQQGVAAVPSGTYTVEVTLNDANSPFRILGTGSHTIPIESASTHEAVINLTSPPNGDQVPQSASVVFSFENSIPGRLLAFEHSTLSQSPQDATHDLNSPLKCLDADVPTPGSNQITATYPGVASRPWIAGKKISWLFLGAVPGSTDTRLSAIYSFTVVPSDPLLARLIGALMNAPDPVGSTYSNLINSGYTLAYSSSNPIYLQEGEGGTPRTAGISEVLSLLADLARRNARLNATVTSQ